VLISAQVAGQVVEMPVTEGQVVQPGDLLARIDDTPYRAQLRQAEALVKAAGSQANAVAATQQGVRTEVSRTQKLLSSGSASDMQLDLLKTQRSALEAQHQAVSSQVEQARAAVALAQTQLGFARVVAPQGGTVLRTHAQVGETMFPGAALLTLADLQTMEIYVYIPEPMLGKVKLDQMVEVFTDSEPGKPRQGRVSYVADTAEFTPKNVQTKDERVRLVYKVKVTIPNADGALKIGMPVDVRFL
jgi:HlyD family secretion protein